MKKYILSLLMLIALPLFGAEATKSISQFKGLVDKTSADMLESSYTPDCLNVLFDETADSVVKRKGSINYLLTPLSQAQWIRRLYSYDRIDGTKYLVIQSSSSLYYSLNDGNATSLTNNKSSTLNTNFTTGEDYALGCNGSDASFDIWGTTYTALTVANSTYVPTGKYNVYWHNRWWIANTTGFTSRVYYSEVGDHRNFNSSNLNYININVQDGQVITGLMISNDRLICTKEKSTWEIYEKIAAAFDARALSFDIGCLYQSTMATYKGLYPIWLSHRGVELYDGQFNLVSEPIDNLVKSLRQLQTDTLNLTQDTAADWSAGSGVNIDTTTYSGSVGIDDRSQISQIDNYGYVNNEPTIEYRQGICPINTATYNNLNLYLYGYLGGGYTNISITDSNMNVIVSSIVTVNYTSWTLQDIKLPAFTLNADTTYYILISSVGSISNTLSIRSSKRTSGGTDYYNRGSIGFKSYTDSTWIDYNSYYPGWYWDLCFIFSNNNASFTTQSQNAGTSWGSWGTFTADQTVPTGSSISHYAVTSTSTYNLTTNTPFALTNGAPINSTVGSYIQVISSLSRTDATAIPLLNKITINYTGASNKEPIGFSYKDRYYLAVDNGSGYNDTVLVYDSNGQWTKLTGNCGSACIYRNELYTGDAIDSGKIFKQDISGIYTDVGTNYNAYWTSSLLNLEAPIQEKTFSELWVIAKNESEGTLDLYYKLYGNDADFTQFSGSLNLYSSFNGLIVEKFTFPYATKSYYLQVKAGVTNSNPFTIKGLGLIYEVQPRR